MGLFDAYASMTHSPLSQWAMPFMATGQQTQSAATPQMQTGPDFQAAQPVTPNGALNTTAPSFQGPSQGLLSMLTQPNASGQTGFQQIAGLGKGLQDGGQGQNSAALSQMMAQAAALLQASPAHRAMAAQGMFQLPGFGMGGR